MFSRLLGNYTDIPIPHEKRKRTDIICFIVSSLLALGMFVFALVTYIQLGILSSMQLLTRISPIFIFLLMLSILPMEISQPTTTQDSSGQSSLPSSAA